MNRIDELIAEAVSLQHELMASLTWGLAPDTSRSRLSRALAKISFEHGSSVIELIACGKYTSATSLLRPQYEALVRSLWLHYCASDPVVARLSDESRLATNEKLPAVSEMLDALGRSAPRSLVTSLIEFRDSSWKPLSSYIHGGIHPVRWTKTGFPDRILHQVLCTCDGLLVFAAVQLGELSGARENGLVVVLLTGNYADVLPAKRHDRDAG